MIISLKNHMFIIFFICLMLATYIGLSEELIIGFVFIFFLISKRVRFTFFTDNKGISLFLLYYFFITIIGCIVGYVKVLSVVKFLVEFILLMYCVDSALYLDKTGGKVILWDFRNLICLSAVYGTVETFTRFNPLANYILVLDWVTAMNTLVSRYQPSSIFLHYTYYAFFLLFGLIILLKFPFKNRIVNICAYVVLLEQIFFSESRIGWISLLFLIIFYCIINNNVSDKIKKSRLCVFIILIFFIPTILVIEYDLINTFYDIVYNRFSSFMIYGMDDGSIGQRWGTLLNYPKYLLQYPVGALFGTGFQSIDNSFLKEFSYFRGFPAVDNQYLTLIVETGVIGFVFFIFAVGSYTKKLWHRNDEIGAFGKLAFLFILIQGVTYNLTSYFQFTLVLIVLCLWQSKYITIKKY